MDSLVGYGSDDDGESGRYSHHPSGGAEAAARRREDDTNYDDVNMDMSEESQDGESEPELPPAAPAAPRAQSDDNRSRSRSSERRDKQRDRDRDRERVRDRERERERSERRDERPERREERPERREERPERRRGLLGDRPAERTDTKRLHGREDAIERVTCAPAGAPRPPAPPARPHDARDAVSHRFVDRRDRDRDRERERDREARPARRPEPLNRPFVPSGERERRGSPAGDYRPSSYKVNKKLEVMEKMGLQIKTPDGSMATARQLRAAALPAGLPAPCAGASARALDQVQKRKLLWASKRGAAEAEAARWSGARFAQDSDGRQVSKFMRLMGIKDPNAVKSDSIDSTQDPNKKQEELFQAMQAQYEVARATTHTMRGVGLGFQRGNF